LKLLVKKRPMKTRGEEARGSKREGEEKGSTDAERRRVPSNWTPKGGPFRGETVKELSVRWACLGREKDNYIGHDSSSGGGFESPPFGLKREEKAIGESTRQKGGVSRRVFE